MLAAEFANRDARLSSYEWFEEVVRWFEHDLYDLRGAIWRWDEEKQKLVGDP